MAHYDFRTKPESEWTFYVVDHLPTMSNLYRYDTVQEAIDKFLTIPANQRSAIGSSLLGRYEVDHIHGIDGHAVLIRDMDRSTNPVWRESEEVCAAVALMREKLRVEYELNSTLFGYDRGVIAVPLSDPGAEFNHYFDDKKLNPLVVDRPLSGINEVFVEGEGWVDIVKFLDERDNREWSREKGYHVPFVTSINIRYVDSRGHRGQADLSPADFKVMRDAYAREMEGDSLSDKIHGAETKAASKANSKGNESVKKNEHGR